MNDNTFDTDVLVVGTGPMGATTALALATYGVRVHVVNRYNWTANTPRAHITNQRAVEVLRDLGVEQEARAMRRLGSGWATPCSRPAWPDAEIARLRTWGTGDERVGDYLQGSPCPLLDMPQDKMEPLLVKNAAARGAVFSFNTEYSEHEQDDSGVTVSCGICCTGRVSTRCARATSSVRTAPGPRSWTTPASRSRGNSPAPPRPTCCSAPT